MKLPQSSVRAFGAIALLGMLAAGPVLAES
jgi:hypothetical protein